MVSEVQSVSSTLSSEGTEGEKDGKTANGFNLQIKRRYNYIKIANAIERFSFYFYPVSFIIFSVLYWKISLYLGGRSPFKSSYEPTKSGVVTLNL